MTAYAPPLESFPVLIGRTERGASRAASQVNEQIEQFVNHYSLPRLGLIIPEIMSLVRGETESLRDPDFAAVDHETAEKAVGFALLLPKSLPIPEIASDPDGEISFDWIGKAGRMFSVSISASGRISYAGRFGDKNKVHGTEELSDFLSQEILRGIEKASK